MFSHVMVGTNDLEKAKHFYDAVLGALGYAEGLLRSKGDYVYASDRGLFMVTRPKDGQSATHANGGTIGFACHSTDQVDHWHAAGVANGGKSIEDPPAFVTPKAAGCISLICAIRMATSSAPCISSWPDTNGRD